MKALSNVGAVTHAIGNTMRRVVIMVVSLAVFKTPLTALGAVGSCLAIGGSYLYALAKSSEASKMKAEKLAKKAATPAVA